MQATAAPTAVAPTSNNAPTTTEAPATTEAPTTTEATTTTSTPTTTLAPTTTLPPAATAAPDPDAAFVAHLRTPDALRLIDVMPEYMEGASEALDKFDVLEGSVQASLAADTFRQQLADGRPLRRHHGRDVRVDLASVPVRMGRGGGRDRLVRQRPHQTQPCLASSGAMTGSTVSPPCRRDCSAHQLMTPSGHREQRTRGPHNGRSDVGAGRAIVRAGRGEGRPEAGVPGQVLMR